jgi:hypothetical protein
LRVFHALVCSNVGNSCAGFFHMSWTATIQVVVCSVILIVNLGVSALVGIGFILLTGCVNLSSFYVFSH